MITLLVAERRRDGKRFWALLEHEARSYIVLGDAGELVGHPASIDFIREYEVAQIPPPIALGPLPEGTHRGI